MTPQTTIQAVRNMVTEYGSDRCLYLHRSIFIVRCGEWEFTDTFISVRVEAERLLAGDKLPGTVWVFGVRWDQVTSTQLSGRMLSAGQMRDTIVLNKGFFELAEAISVGTVHQSVQDFWKRVLC